MLGTPCQAIGNFLFWPPSGQCRASRPHETEIREACEKRVRLANITNPSRPLNTNAVSDLDPYFLALLFVPATYIHQILAQSSKVRDRRQTALNGHLHYQPFY